MTWSLSLILAIVALVLAVLVLLDIVPATTGLALAVIVLAIPFLISGRGRNIRIG